MKKRNNPLRSAGALGSVPTALTGYHCPSNGFWQPAGQSSEPLFIFEGSIMPTSGGESTLWHLVDPALLSPARRSQTAASFSTGSLAFG